VFQRDLTPISNAWTRCTWENWFGEFGEFGELLDRGNLRGKPWRKRITLGIAATASDSQQRRQQRRQQQQVRISPAKCVRAHRQHVASLRRVADATHRRPASPRRPRCRNGRWQLTRPSLWYVATQGRGGHVAAPSRFLEVDARARFPALPFKRTGGPALVKKSETMEWKFIGANCASDDAPAHLLRWPKRRSWLRFVPCYIRSALRECATSRHLGWRNARAAAIRARIRARASAVFESVASTRESLVEDFFLFPSRAILMDLNRNNNERTNVIEVVVASRLLRA